ncbi:MAG: bifunctional phosphopantothenoylcysteine decarboxylase/phosphopantothenate--cysteine ligase CoaBC [Bacteroidales bacterium]
MLLEGKHILLGVTGSIAAYKSAILVRTLVKEGALVKVVMTGMAKQFITPLTMATLSKNPILVDFYNPENGDWNSHVSMGIWADIFVIAPCSANTIGKMVAGIADNLLLTTYLSAKCPVAIAPAMDLDMYKHPSTQNNLKILAQRGVTIIEPTSGELASGLEGKGRMEEPEKIIPQIEAIFAKKGSLAGKNILITAGPTREAIDPVRYITNHSSGKMAYALAIEAANRGANVTVISGPTNLSLIHPYINVINVVTAAEMFNKTKENQPSANIIILCAAVSDFTVAHVAQNKIKRAKENYNIELMPTCDIAAWVGNNKKKDSVLVGFALETDNEIDNAKGKLIKKNLDIIVLNSMQDSGAGFGVDTNKVSLIFKEKETITYPLKSKSKVAVDIVDNIENLLICSDD